MIRVASFDIFDTCLTRTFAYPIDLFIEVGKIARNNGWITVTPAEFAVHRIEAERSARKLVPSGEINVTQIYRQLGSDLGLAPHLVSEIQNAELVVEGQSLQPIGEMRSRVARAREEGRQILFLSDMYLPTAFLESVLRKHEFFQEGDLLYVSGEVGRHKGDGGLFQHARAQLKQEITEWLHVGDNRRADVESPRRLGLNAEHFESGLLNRYELLICPGIGFRSRVKRKLMNVSRLDRVIKPSRKSPNPKREQWQSRLVAAMRLARLSKPPGLSPREKIIWDNGANLVGPVFYGYVKWLLGEAEQRKLPRLYFVARDGQIMLKIAQVIQSFRPGPVECRYLYGSRGAWVPASLFEIDAFHLNWILERTPSLSLRDIFSRIEVTPENHRALLESSGFAEATWGAPVTKAQLARLPDVLRTPALSSEIKKVAEVKREKFLQYLRQEGVFEHDQVAMVDLGGNGSLKQALTQVCANSPDQLKPQVLGFYFGLIRSPLRQGDGFFGYINSVYPKAMLGFLFTGQLLECFTAADHGQTRGYEKGHPILSQLDNPAVTAWGLPVLHEGALAFCRAYAALDDSSCPPPDYLKATSAALMLFFEKPTLEEIKIWGAFPFSGQRVETGLSSLLPPWNRNQILAKLFTKERGAGLWWAPALAKREKAIFLHFYYLLQKMWKKRKSKSH